MSCPANEPIIPGRTFKCVSGRLVTGFTPIYVTVSDIAGDYTWRTGAFIPPASAYASAETRTTFDTSVPTLVPDGGQQGATALCNDGWLSHSAHHSGTCSHHGGVLTWYR